MADDTVIRPPDQIAAGGSAQPPEQGGILDALRSRGPAPQAALQNIMQPQPGPNMGSAFGSGVLGALAGQPGSNPYLAQQQQGQKDAFYQQLNVQRQRDAQAEKEFRRNEASLKIMRDVLGELPEGEARDAVARTYAQGISKFTGQQFAGPLASALATKRVDPETVNGVLEDGAQGMDPKLISLKRGIPVDKVQGILKTDPKTLERLGADTKAQRDAKLSDQRLKNIKLIEAEYPPVKGHPEMVQTMLQAHAKLNQGRSFEEGTPESRAQAYEIAKLKTLDAQAAEEARQEAAKLRVFGQEAFIKEGIASRLQEQRDVAAERRLGLKEQATKEKAQTAAQQKKAQAIVVAKTFLKQYESYIDQLDEGGFLPKDGGVYESGRANVKQGHVPIPGVSQPNDKVWRGWLDLQGNMIGFARSVQNDIGPRAMAAFNQAVRVSEHPPTKEGLRQILKQMQEQLDAAESGTVPAGVGPLQTPLPPGAKMEGGKVVSEDGLYVWDGTAWQRR